MYIQIERVLTTITRPHQIRIGIKNLTVSPGMNQLQFDMDPNEDVYAKLPHEHDWFNYGKARDYVHGTHLNYELQLFSKNSNPIQKFRNEEGQGATSNKKSKKSWW